MIWANKLSNHKQKAGRKEGDKKQGKQSLLFFTTDASSNNVNALLFYFFHITKQIFDSILPARYFKGPHYSSGFY